VAVTRSQIASNSATGTSVDITLVSGPTAGRLLIITHYAAGTLEQSAMAGPAGWTTVVSPLSSYAAGVAIYAKVATGSEGTGPFTVTSSAAAGSVFNAAQYTEWDAGATWASAAGDAIGRQTVNSPGTTVTTTATGASTQAVEFAIVGLGLNGTGTFADTWTGGFTTQASIIGSRFNSATKETTATETYSTTETWATSRTPRSALASFPIPSGTANPEAPTGLSVTAVSDSQIDLSWTAGANTTGHRIVRDGKVLVDKHTGSNSYSDTGLTASTTHDYEVWGVA
jgi:hypothetical protein